MYSVYDLGCTRCNLLPTYDGRNPCNAINCTSVHLWKNFCITRQLVALSPPAYFLSFLYFCIANQPPPPVCHPTLLLHWKYLAIKSFAVAKAELRSPFIFTGWWLLTVSNHYTKCAPLFSSFSIRKTQESTHNSHWHFKKMKWDFFFLSFVLLRVKSLWEPERVAVSCIRQVCILVILYF